MQALMPWSPCVMAQHRLLPSPRPGSASQEMGHPVTLAVGLQHYTKPGES